MVVANGSLESAPGFQPGLPAMSKPLPTPVRSRLDAYFRCRAEWEPFLKEKGGRKSDALSALRISDLVVEQFFQKNGSRYQCRCT
jgi:hypothetical protein